MGREAQRIRFLIEREGRDGARAWVQRTLEAYRAALQSPASHAAVTHYRPLFEESVRDFERWLAGGEEHDPGGAGPS